MASGQRFFRKTLPQEGVVSLTEYTHVGPCGFQALAEWLLLNFDDILMYPRAKIELANIVLRYHFTYFPQHEPMTQMLLTPVNCMRYLKENVPAITSAFAYTLKRIAFNELCRDPIRYRDFFTRINEAAITLQTVFQSMDFDDHSILALTHVLQLNIDIQDSTADRPIYALTQYQHNKNQRMTHATAFIKRSGRDYYLSFHSENTMHTFVAEKISEPVVPNLEHHNSIAEIRKLLIEDADLLNKRFIRAHSDLSVSNLTKEDLLMVYIKLLSDKVDFPQQGKRSGVEHGYQHFFANLTDDDQHPRILTDCYDEQLRTELLRAIARAIALDDVSLDEVFDCIIHDSGPAYIKT